MRLTLVLGAQFGDEGKGKVVDFLAANADVVVRFNGGNNAGHTVVVGDKTYKFHLVPSGAVRGKVCCLASGMAINPSVLVEEIEMLKRAGKRFKLLIDPRAQIIMPYHILLDGAKEKSARKKIGTTKRGIGPCYADRAFRSGIRFCEFIEPKIFKERLRAALPFKRRELASYGIRCPSEKKILKEFLPLARKLKSYEADVSLFIQKALKQKKRILLEGAQGFFLDNDFGTYPYVTSSHPITGGALIGIGIPPGSLERIIGVAKAYCTRVGSGPFVTELKGKLANFIREKGMEYGTTTGRPRRVGWLDLVMLRTASRICGFTELAITKLDVLSGLRKLKVCYAYKHCGKEHREVPANTFEVEKCRPVYREFKGFKLPEKIKSIKDLPKEARIYLRFIEKQVKVPIKIISYGPERKQTIFNR
ncbi:MAG: adenylosuccinate synthase [Candidatus Diapherotrites archaeon]|nr:adenylosuccinate synthase [Candidatus Diapherotrites archaeon]